MFNMIFILFFFSITNQIPDLSKQTYGFYGTISNEETDCVFASIPGHLTE